MKTLGNYKKGDTAIVTAIREGKEIKKEVKF